MKTPSHVKPMSADGSLAQQFPLSRAACALRRVEVVINPHSGSADAASAKDIEAMFGELGLPVRIQILSPADVESKLRAAVEAEPDLLVVLAGDGTARAAASLCGMDGPMIAPLPGGTMNMLPRAVYGTVDWRVALRGALGQGVERVISGGEIDGRRFYVAAILGAPAMWAEVREAARAGKAHVALQKAKDALERAFASHLRFSLDGLPPRKAEALTLMCPLVSRGLSADTLALEAAVLHPAGALEAFRLALRVMAGEVAGDWRHDPAVDVTKCRRAVAWANGRIPAILDGEPTRLGRSAQVRFVARAFRVLAPEPAGEAHMRAA